MQAVSHSATDARHAALLAELRDGLARFQPEIPSRYLLDPAVQELRDRVGKVFAHRHAVEHGLMARLFPTLKVDGDSSTTNSRVFFCLGGALGRTTVVGSVRLLRAQRAAMRGGDRLMIGVDLHEAIPELTRLFADLDGANAALHTGILSMLNERFGADFDVARLEYRVVAEADSKRVETHVVARRPHTISIAGIPAVVLKRRQSIRVSMRSTFSRPSLEALVNAVGLTLEQWLSDESAGYAVAIATPMRREQ